MKPRKLILMHLCILLISTSTFIELSYGQATFGKQTLKRGRLWSTVWNTLQYGDPTETENAYYVLDYPGYSHGSDLTDELNYSEAAGYAIYGVRDSFALSYTINSRFFPSQQDIFPTEEELLTTNYNLQDNNIAGEEIATGGHHVNALNVDIYRRSMVWSYPGLSDFIIHEVTITNDDISPVTKLYFGMRYGFFITQRSGTRGDEKYGWDATEKVFYFYDHRSFNFTDETPIVYNFGVGPQRGDIGDAADIYQQGSRDHELNAPGYVTVAVLDSAGANVYQNILEHTGQGVTEGAQREDVMFRQGFDPSSRFKEVMTHQQPRMSWDDAKAAGGEGGNKYERRPEFLVSVGPLTLSPYGTVKLVFAEVVGEMDRAKIVAGGVANIDLMATASRDSMLAHLRAARQLYANNYKPSVYPPPTPTNGENSLTITSEPGIIKISWPPVPSSYRDPILGVNDLAGYRVYRSTYFTIGPWTLIADIKKDSNLVDGVITYSDRDVNSGVGNYYCVTSYDNDGNETGKVNNNRFPVYPLIAPNSQFPKNVYVVPNPFRQHSGLLGTGERYRIEFVGLPAKCTIKIYTIMGELVQQIEHDDGSGSDAWGSIAQGNYQLSKWLLDVSPGVYIFRVESHVSGHVGENSIGKFAIIK